MRFNSVGIQNPRVLPASALSTAPEIAVPSHVTPTPVYRIADLDIRTVWGALGGGPLRSNRGKAFWRKGDGLNVQVYPSTGTWRDFATAEGGGILALVQNALGSDKRAAVAWLADQFGITAAEPWTTQQRREFSRLMDESQHLAAAIVERRDCYLGDLRFAAAVLLTEYHRLLREGEEKQDIDLLAMAINVWELDTECALRRDRLKSASGAELLRFFAEIEARVLWRMR